MSQALIRRSGPHYKEVVVATPAEKAYERALLESLQVATSPMIELSRHSFRPPLSFSLHQRHDPILQAVYPILHNFSYSTLAGYCNPLEIEPLFSTNANFLLDAIRHGVPASAMYVIGRYGFVAKVRLFMHSWNGRDHQILAQDGDKFLNLTQWLDTIPHPYGTTTGINSYDYLQGWWQAKGAMFRLMDLPVELWTYIFEVAFGMDIYPSGPNDLGTGTEIQKPYVNGKVVPPPTKGILLLNKTIHKAILPFVRKGTCKCFESAYAMNTYAASFHSRGLSLENLRVLEFDFTNPEYFYVFGVQVAPFINNPQRIFHASRVTATDILTGLKGLSHLYLRFTAPSDGAQDPWYDTGKYNGHVNDRRTFDFQGNATHWAVGCQKVLVDWILTFAKQHIQHIPNITLTGCIKDSIKTKWAKIFEDERGNMGKEVHEMESMKEVIKNWDLADL